MNIRLRLWMFAILLFSYFNTGTAQSFCGTSILDQQKSLLGSDDTYSIKERSDLMYFPLQVHNVGNDNGQSYYSIYRLYESLCTLNEDFLASGIQFYLESDIQFINKTAWNDHPEYSGGREMMRINNVFERINCYIVNNPAGNCGYYVYDEDGVALSKNCLGKQSHTWAHELGHFFSLPHTFFGWEGITYSTSRKTSDYQREVFTNIENVIRNNCKNQADNFCDTPPDYISSRWSCNSSGESPIYQKDTRDSIFKSDGSLFMSYSNEQCMKRFSVEQMSAMHRNIQLSRPELHRPNLNVVPRLVGPVDLIFPPDSSLINRNNVLFKWSPVRNAKYYLFRLSRTSNFSVVVKNLFLSNTQVFMDTLVPNVKYYWDVKAVSDFDFCGVESVNNYFKTEPLMVGIDEQEAQTEIHVFPNPVSPGGIITIQSWKGFIPVAQIQMINLEGSEIHNLVVEKNTDEFYYCTLPEQLIKGIYILRVMNNTKIISKKVIVN